MNNRPWTVDDSASIYNLKGWGLKYFRITPEGRLAVHPRFDIEHPIEIRKLIDDVLSRGLRLPVLFRFQDLLRHRVELLNETFKKAVSDFKYKGRYYGVYPIKVNQLREVVEEILDAGAPYQFGLEAGSLGELVAVLAMNNSEGLTILNGYKDETMMRLAMIGTKIGKKVIVVIEKPGELGLLIKAARDLNVVPTIGLRVRLQTEGSGKWKYSSGHSAKFGLTTSEILEAVSELKSAGLVSSAKLLHFHIGSQITNIQTIKDAVKEASRVYAKLRKMGVEMEYLDCGGGLGVDYDGSHSSVDSSVNYNLREYARALVMTIQEVCRQEKVPEPHIVTESGRSLVAHHSMLAVNVFGLIEGGARPTEFPPSEEEHEIVKSLRALFSDLNPKTIVESYHQAVQKRDEAFSLFNLGYLGLEDRAKAETLFWSLCREIGSVLAKIKDVPDDIVEMSKALRDQYLCNFSIFQSLPDSWAIGQLFPIMPLERLNEEPTHRAALVDITCDSDGKISQFACHRKAGGTLPLHPIKNGEPYYLGVFLMGAYQATMGDIHNLFGRVSEVHVFEDPTEPSGYYIEEMIQGQNVRDVLQSIQYSDFELVKMLKSAIDSRVRSGAIKPREGVDLLDEYEAAMKKYTYIDYGISPKTWARRATDISPKPNFVET